jgi:hypothetical protein
MNRKRAVTFLGVVCCLAILVGGLGLLLTHQPAFYATALDQTVSAEERSEQSKAFVQSTLQLVDAIRYEEHWSQEFHESAVNGWLADELPGKYAEWLPPGVTAPRIKFDDGTLLVAFNARRGMWQGVVSIQIRPWFPEPNELALEIQSTRIGLIPVPADELVNGLVAGLNAAGWTTRWKNAGKREILIIDLASPEAVSHSGPHPVFETVELEPQLLRLTGQRAAQGAEPAEPGRLTISPGQSGAR